jgi:hypothetical protein
MLFKKIIDIYYDTQNRDTSVDIVMAWELDGRGSIPGRGKGFFSTPHRPNRYWGSSSLQYNGYRRFFPRDKAAAT